MLVHASIYHTHWHVNSVDQSQNWQQEELRAYQNSRWTSGQLKMLKPNFTTAEDLEKRRRREEEEEEELWQLLKRRSYEKLRNGSSRRCNSVARRCWRFHCRSISEEDTKSRRRPFDNAQNIILTENYCTFVSCMSCFWKIVSLLCSNCPMFCGMAKRRSCCSLSLPGLTSIPWLGSIVFSASGLCIPMHPSYLQKMHETLLMVLSGVASISIENIWSLLVPFAVLFCSFCSSLVKRF